MTESFCAEQQMKKRVQDIQNRVALAARQSGREPDEIHIMAVTKTVSVQLVNLAVQNGISLLGENRVQEFLEKRADYREGCEVHFIGNLQSNKVKYIIDKVSMIQSVGSIKLAEEIQKQAAKADKIIDVLLEVNIGREQSKFGVLPEDLDAVASRVSELSNLRLSGLMAIPPFAAEQTQQREHFLQMRELFLDMKHKNRDNGYVRFLSMGMSADFEVAIQCGSNLVRLGTVLFGERK